MQKSTIADMMRSRATDLRMNSLDGDSRMSSGQCALILMEYVKLLEILEFDPISDVLKPPFVAGDFPQAYNGCSCVCHSQLGVTHCVPCCSPTLTIPSPRHGRYE